MVAPSWVTRVRIVGSHITTALAGNQGIPIPANANGMWIQARVQDVYIRFDSNPASSGGSFQIRAGDPPLLMELPAGSGLNAVQGTTGAILEVQPVFIG